MQDILPHEIVSRSQPTVFLSLFMRGIERERDSLGNHFADVGASWQPYVRDVWLQQNWQKEITPQTDGPTSVVPWLCVSFGSWLQKTFLVE